MQETTAAAPARPKLRAQRIGRRIGAEPYYTIVEQRPDRLLLRSRPELNQPMAKRFVLFSILLGLPAVVMLVTGIVIVPKIGQAGLLLVIPGLTLGTAALVASTIGRTLRRLVNSISLDSTARTVIFAQQLGAKPPKRQILRFDLIVGLRLRRRMVKLFPAFMGRERELVLLELKTAGGGAWLVDSAADPALLRPTARALAALLALPFEES